MTALILVLAAALAQAVQSVAVSTEQQKEPADITTPATYQYIGKADQDAFDAFIAHLQTTPLSHKE